jgi:hypothetical protein
MPTIIPEETRDAIRSRGYSLKFIQKLENISPPERSFLGLIREFTIRVVLLPNQVYPWDGSPIEEFMEKFKEHGLVLSFEIKYNEPPSTLIL